MAAEPFDLVVVGGGIAGLATAELFARSGSRVLLVEANPRLCQETSGRHHEWFHFGSLYSIFPGNQHLRTMVGGIDDLLEFYSEFEGMNLEVTGAGELRTPARPGAWFGDEQIEYVVSATNDPDFSVRAARGLKDAFDRLSMGLAWDVVIKQFVSRHNRFYAHDWRRKPASRYIPRAGIFDYSRRNIEKFADPDVRLDPDTHFKIRGYDRPFSAHAIVSGLAGSLLGCGGELRLSTEYTGYETAAGGLTVRLGGGESVRARRLVIATGRSLRQHLKGRFRVQVVVSPLLIVYPAVCRQHFARLTPFMPQTVNHLRHSHESVPYSLIGGGYFADPEDAPAVRRVDEQLRARAAAVFPGMASAEFVSSYFSHKTEIVGDFSKRNYQYRIERVDRDVYCLLPGKFSLSFSLAVNAYRRILGAEPVRRARAGAGPDVSGCVDLMLHKKMLKQHLASRSVTASA